MTDDDRLDWLSRRRALALGGVALGSAAVGGLSLASAQEDDEDEEEDEGGDGAARYYRVTVANLTPGQPFTPPAVAAHRADVEVFAVGEPANEATQQLAENGNLGPLLDLVESTNSIRGAAVADTPLVPASDPGETGLPYYASVELAADASAGFMTFVSMLIATNDGIVGLDTVPLPGRVNESRTYYANGYDVGTEENTELFGDLVPPAKTLIVGGEPEGTAESDPELATDDVIKPHPGISGEGDLDPELYGWHEPAAVVQVERIEAPDPEEDEGGMGDGEDDAEEGEEDLQTEFEAALSGDAEVPPVDTDAEGEATFEYDGDDELIEYEVSVEDIDDVVAAHIHCAPAGENGPVGVTLFSGGPVSPDGTLVEGDITEPDADNDCEWETLDDVVAAFRAGEAYVNVHTEGNPAGEVRGQVE